MLARGRPQHDKRKDPSVHPSLGTSEGTRRRTERRTGGVRGFCFKPGCGSDDEEEVAHWKSFRTGDLKKRGILLAEQKAAAGVAESALNGGIEGSCQ